MYLYTKSPPVHYGNNKILKKAQSSRNTSIICQLKMIVRH